MPKIISENIINLNVTELFIFHWCKEKIFMCRNEDTVILKKRIFINLPSETLHDDLINKETKSEHIY